MANPGDRDPALLGAALPDAGEAEAVPQTEQAAEAETAADAEAEAEAAADGGDRPPPRASMPHRDIRPHIYAALDAIMACVYAIGLFGLLPNRHAWAQVLSGATVAAALAMAVGTALRRPWSWWLAAIGCGFLLGLAVVFLALCLISAAFLAGTYGSFGRAASAFAVLIAAVFLEFFALLPAFQLKFLMTRAGRRCFGRDPA